MGSGGGGKGKEISWGGLGFCNGGWLLVLEKEKGGGGPWIFRLESFG